MKNRNILTSGVCVLIVFLSNFFVPSQINGFPKSINLSFKNCWENPHAELVFESRYQNSEFRRRPFVLEFQNWTHKTFNLPYQFSFNLINFVGLFLLFLILPKLSKTISRKSNSGFILQLSFLFSLPILCAFYGSIFTYDDIVQYLLLSIFLIFLFKENHIVSALFFLLACIARETSLIYLLLVFFYLYNQNKLNYIKIIVWIMPLILYFTFIYFYLNESTLSASKAFLFEKRFSAWKTNFQDFKTLRETSTIMFVMLGFPSYFVINRIRKTQFSEGVFWSKFSLMFLSLNLIVVLISGLVRESRLLFVPLCFILPLVVQQLEKFSISLKKRFRQIDLKKEIIILFISALISFVWYSPSVVGTGYIFKMYVFVYLILFLELFYPSYLAHENT